MCSRERVVNPTPTVPTPVPQIERVINPNPPSQPPPPPVPTYTFQAAAPISAADLSAEAVAKAAPKSLGGLAARFTIPTGKNGYSKSLRPEAGRLVR